MNLLPPHEMHHSGKVRVLGIPRHAIHAKGSQRDCRLPPVAGILSSCHPLLGDDHEAHHETVVRLRNHHHGRDGRGGDQNGSS